MGRAKMQWGVRPISGAMKTSTLFPTIRGHVRLQSTRVVSGRQKYQTMFKVANGFLE